MISPDVRNDDEPDGEPQQLERPKAISKEEEIEAEREQVLAAVAATKFDTLQERIAWILNRYPDTRNSDLALQIRHHGRGVHRLGGAGPPRAPSASACEPYRELIADALRRGRNAVAIWQDLVDDHGFAARSRSLPARPSRVKLRT